MAMYPVASRGYMPFVSGQNGQKRPTGIRYVAKHGKHEHRRLKAGKTYQVTLKDKNGATFTYILKTDGATKSLPVLCNSMVNGLKSTDSLPTIGLTNPKRNFSSSMSLDTDSRDGEEKKGFLSSIFRFLKEKTGKSKSGKSKRKQKVQPVRKRQRTVSAMSNLDPIQESPDEYDYEEEDDNESYTHESSSISGSESDNLSCDSVGETVS